MQWVFFFNAIFCLQHNVNSSLDSTATPSAMDFLMVTYQFDKTRNYYFYHFFILITLTLDAMNLLHFYSVFVTFTGKLLPCCISSCGTQVVTIISAVMVTAVLLTAVLLTAKEQITAKYLFFLFFKIIYVSP